MLQSQNLKQNNNAKHLKRDCWCINMLIQSETSAFYYFSTSVGALQEAGKQHANRVTYFERNKFECFERFMHVILPIYSNTSRFQYILPVYSSIFECYKEHSRYQRAACSPVTSVWFQLSCHFYWSLADTSLFLLQMPAVETALCQTGTLLVCPYFSSYHAESTLLKLFIGLSQLILQCYYVDPSGEPHR